MVKVRNESLPEKKRKKKLILQPKFSFRKFIPSLVVFRIFDRILENKNGLFIKRMAKS